MSRQYDDYMSDKFEVNGDRYQLVDPTSFEELLEALEIKGIIESEISSLMHDEDSSGWAGFLQEQEYYIQGYLESLGEFDNTTLINNINYLAKKNGLRFGDLENMLNLSAGYISRTTKENSKKKLSINVVWKIAQLFEVDLKSLIETDLEIPNSNTEMAIRFVDKLRQQTEENTIEWEPNGGVLRFLQERYTTLGLVTDEDDVSVYHPEHLNTDLKWVLDNDIFACKGIDKDKELVVIPFKWDGKEEVFFDFIFVWSSGESGLTDSRNYHWEKAFYSEDDRYGNLRKHAAALYDAIQNQDCDAKVAPSVRNLITDYLK
ncbi:MAG: XRE family transcriptional regulator [Candidatus Metalachnospira sp.]|nr:XRE family transcriptional regulator [Candidatus Metalachnospira sp.]